MDAEYLKASVGEALASGMAATVVMRPEDPVDFLAQYLLKLVDDQAAAQALALQKEATHRELAAEKKQAEAVGATMRQKEAAVKMQEDREDKRLHQLLSSADLPEDAFSAILGFIRTRTSASAYVMATDLPQKVRTVPERPYHPLPL